MVAYHKQGLQVVMKFTPGALVMGMLFVAVAGLDGFKVGLGLGGCLLF